jgi:hypothetical protein
LPVDQWHGWTNEDKRTIGIVGGGGASFVRAGREIDYGWKLFGGKRRENYDDWWRCEVSFEPDLDELFGVTHSKQGVSPTPYIRSILEADMEATARVLNSRVRVAFGAVKRASPSEAALRATLQEHWLPPTTTPAKLPKVRGAVRYAIAMAPIPSPSFFEITERQGMVLVTINTDHPFHERLYAPAVADPTGRQRFAIECVLLAAARASVAVSGTTDARWVDRYREAWSDALAAFLETKRAHP